MSNNYNSRSYKNNAIQLHGRVIKINEYSAGKAARITIAAANDGYSQNFVQVKNFHPECYNLLKVGMQVHAYGHIQPGRYQKDGKTVFTQDIVADDIEFLENKASVDIREAAKAAAPPAKLNVMQRREFHD